MPILLDNTYRIVPAFDWGGETYYMHEDPMNTATGRGLSGMQALEELLMRCSLDYLKAHVDACDEIFSNSKRIDLPKLIKLNSNLRERINLLFALPDNVYKLAAVVFFTRDESPYKYDRVAGNRKIRLWKDSPDMYDFFLQGHLKTLIPYLSLPEEDTQKYLEVEEQINKMHLKDLHEVLSRDIGMQERMN